MKRLLPLVLFVGLFGACWGVALLALRLAGLPPFEDGPDDGRVWRILVSPGWICPIPQEGPPWLRAVGDGHGGSGQYMSYTPEEKMTFTLKYFPRLGLLRVRGNNRLERDTTVRIELTEPGTLTAVGGQLTERRQDARTYWVLDVPAGPSECDIRVTFGGPTSRPESSPARASAREDAVP